eukprot:TRINITY_DN63738_c0_g1_i1.p1 TRINITY_DN63738_c0_g1~~TRINITY_DN63738_c0_g1_i1.p1  ORF type:complete len:684 (-),score=245.57 TRINITY_DN63738_c0_g1_i1:84-2135(-)
MKFQASLFALFGTLAAASGGSPVAKVIMYIKELEEETKADMKKEKESFEKYADWCKETIKTANTEIDEARKIIAEQTAIVEKMSGKAGAALAEVEYLKKSLGENSDSQKQAESIRAKERAKYEEAESDFQEGIKAMKDMMKSLLEPDTAEGASFLSTGSGSKSAEARSRNVAARFMRFPALVNKLSLSEANSLTSFVNGKLALAQVHVGENLLEDPASNLGGVINIIQQTIEDYEGDLKVAVKEEEGKVANHEKLMKSLTDEHASMTDNLAEQMATDGESIKALSDAKMLRHETEVELEADEKLLVQTEDACEVKKHQFDARTLLRKEELAGITKAIEILDSPEARAKFESAAEVSFVQLSSSAHHQHNREKAFDIVKKMAAQYQNMALVRLAVKIKNHGGHFDKVITIIDKQIKMLREEMKLDVTHRDRCDKQVADNKKLIADLTKQSEKAAAKIEKFTTAKTELKGEYDILLKEMDETMAESAELEENRNKERQEFLVAVQHDKDALAIVKQAIVTLTEFYKNNKIELTLVQSKADPAPDAGFEDKNYIGQQDKTNGVVRLLKQVSEDVADEIATAQKDDAKSQDLFSEEFTSLKNKLDAQTEQKVTTEKAMADLQRKIEDKTQYKDETDQSNEAADEEKEALKKDCAWVKTKFAERRKARMAEINGLNDAKALLVAGESE